MMYYKLPGKVCHRNDIAVIGLPMSLVIILILSVIIFSLFAVGSNYVVIHHQKTQVKECIHAVCEKLSLMKAYGSDNSQLMIPVEFPEIVEVIIFGCDQLEKRNSSTISYPARHCVLIQFSSGNQEVMHCPVAFCNEQKKPLVFHTGRYQVLFSLKNIDGEVISVGSIKG